MTEDQVAYAWHETRWLKHGTIAWFSNEKGARAATVITIATIDYHHYENLSHLQ